MMHDDFLSSSAITARRQFSEVDANNPDVWRLFEHFALDRIQMGFAHYSAGAVMDRVRWETSVPLEDKSGYKVNSRWVAYYARKFLMAHPEHREFFRLRESEADAQLDVIREIVERERA